MTKLSKILTDFFRRCICQSLFIIGIVFITIPITSFAATRCAITAIASVDFGTYDVFSSFPNNNGVGSITIDCQGGGSNILVALSNGQSSNYVSRLMRSGENSMKYNLYTSAARNVVWGDGTGGSSTMMINKNSTTTLSVFGQIPAEQDAAVGFYTDSITTIIIF
jgi:spore coat protein U-like protein